MSCSFVATSESISRIQGAEWNIGPGSSIGTAATMGCGTPFSNTVKSDAVRPRIGRWFLSRTVTSNCTTSTRVVNVA